MTPSCGRPKSASPTSCWPRRWSRRVRHFNCTTIRQPSRGTSPVPQNIGYLWKVHVDETEELAEQAGRKYVQGPSNPFLAGNEGTVNPALLALPGLNSTQTRPAHAGRGHGRAWRHAERPGAALRAADPGLHHHLGHAEDGHCRRFGTSWNTSALAASFSGTVTVP